jgi:hypothetical protein
VIALPLTLGVAGATLQYLMTGKGPSELRDYYFPRTGRIGPDGTEERFELPSYLKDILHYSNHPWDTIKGKVHPLLATVVDMLNNEDYYGGQIRNPDDPLVQQAHQEAGYLAQQFEPFGIRNARDEAQRDQPWPARVAPFVGVTRAPREMVRSPAVNRMMDLLSHRRTVGATPEQADRRDLLRGVKRDVRAGHGGPALARIGEAMQSGQVSGGQAVKAIKGAGIPNTLAGFEQLTAPEAFEVFQLGTPDEKALWAAALSAKLKASKSRGGLPVIGGPR